MQTRYREQKKTESASQSPGLRHPGSTRAEILRTSQERLEGTDHRGHQQMLNSSDSSRSCRRHAELWMGPRLSSRTHNRLLCSRDRVAVSILFLSLLACSSLFPKKANRLSDGAEREERSSGPGTCSPLASEITSIAIALPSDGHRVLSLEFAVVSGNKRKFH